MKETLKYWLYAKGFVDESVLTFGTRFRMEKCATEVKRVLSAMMMVKSLMHSVGVDYETSESEDAVRQLNKGRQKLRECLEAEYSLDAVKNVHAIFSRCFAERHVSGSNMSEEGLKVTTFEDILKDVGAINRWDMSQTRMQDFVRALEDSVVILKRDLNKMKRSHVFAHEFRNK